MQYQCKTKSGVGVSAVSAAEMKELDRIAMEETGPNLYQMMENAGRNLASFVINLLGSNWREKTTLILAGSGGNGGGGICSARHLANHGGKVLLCTPPSEMLSEVTLFQHKIFSSTPGREISPAQLPGSGIDLIIDAIIGYGLTSAPHGLAADLIDWTNQSNIPVVSMDIPSGVNATTGAKPGDAINPSYILTLALPKTGLSNFTDETLYLADIGIPGKAFSLMKMDYSSPFSENYIVPFTFTES